MCITFQGNFVFCFASWTIELKRNFWQWRNGQYERKKKLGTVKSRTVNAGTVEPKYWVHKLYYVEKSAESAQLCSHVKPISFYLWFSVSFAVNQIPKISHGIFKDLWNYLGMSKGIRKRLAEGMWRGSKTLNRFLSLKNISSSLCSCTERSLNKMTSKLASVLSLLCRHRLSDFSGHRIWGKQNRMSMWSSDHTRSVCHMSLFWEERQQNN